MKLSAEVASAASIHRAIVLETQREGTAVVQCEGHHHDPLTCDLLVVGGSQGGRVTSGDLVLVWWSGLDDERAVVIGRIGATLPDPPAPPSPDSEPHGMVEELVLEARQSLTLRVGDGSITIRADGKILIKGKDLVSHAQRVNRIKGGSVAIN